MITIKSLITDNVCVAYVIHCKRQGIAFAVYLIHQLLKSYYFYRAKRDLIAAIKKKEGIHVFRLKGSDPESIVSTIAQEIKGEKLHHVTFHVNELLKTKAPEALIASYLDQLKPTFSIETLSLEIHKGMILLYPYGLASQKIQKLLESLFSKGIFTYEESFLGVRGEVTYKLKGVICIQSVEGDFFSYQRIV